MWDDLDRPRLTLGRPCPEAEKGRGHPDYSEFGFTKSWPCYARGRRTTTLRDLKRSQLNHHQSCGFLEHEQRKQFGLQAAAAMTGSARLEFSSLPPHCRGCQPIGGTVLDRHNIEPPKCPLESASHWRGKSGSRSGLGQGPTAMQCLWWGRRNLRLRAKASFRQAARLQVCSQRTSTLLQGPVPALST